MRSLLCTLALVTSLGSAAPLAADDIRDADWLRAYLTERFGGCDESHGALVCVTVGTASTAPVHFLRHCGGPPPRGFFGVAWGTVSRNNGSARFEERRKSIAFFIACVHEKEGSPGVLIVRKESTGPWPESLPPRAGRVRR